METVGWINAVRGRVTAVDDDGRARELRLHEPVYADETLIAALDATADVRLLNGAELSVAPGTLVVLDADVFEQDDAVDDGCLCLKDLQRVLHLLSQSAHRSVA